MTAAGHIFVVLLMSNLKRGMQSTISSDSDNFFEDRTKRRSLFTGALVNYVTYSVPFRLYYQIRATTDIQNTNIQIVTENRTREYLS